MSEQNTVGRAPELPKYFGSKTIRATPMTLGVYNATRGWEIPSNENPHREGYYLIYEDGYVSWSPKEIFESAYRLTTGLTFGQAIEAAKAGKRVARAGWNGKGMWVAVGAGNPSLEADKFWTPHTRSFAEANGGTAEVLPYLLFKTADDKILMGWLASQTDILSEDWCILD